MFKVHNFTVRTSSRSATASHVTEMSPATAGHVAYRDESFCYSKTRGTQRWVILLQQVTWQTEVSHSATACHVAYRDESFCYSKSRGRGESFCYNRSRGIQRWVILLQQVTWHIEMSHSATAGQVAYREELFFEICFRNQSLLTAAHYQCWKLQLYFEINKTE